MQNTRLRDEHHLDARRLCQVPLVVILLHSIRVMDERGDLNSVRVVVIPKHVCVEASGKDCRIAETSRYASHQQLHVFWD
jgi:hypothetical protein